MEPARISRRDLITAGAVAGVVALAPRAARAQGPPKPAEPATVITTPPRDWGPGAAPNVYGADPDILTIDPSFNSLRQGNTPILRLWTGSLWAEGPAWCGQGRYLVWSDIPNNRQLRWLEDDGRVSVFRMPSNNSNGNTFDFQGRQLSCEHLTRRVVRYEHDGSITLIADGYAGKRLNSPNDVVPHPDGSYWFTDPPYGGQFYEGTVDVAVPEGQLSSPNGLCFSPDYKKLYVISTGRGPGDTGPGGNRDMHVFDVGSDNKLSNQKLFTDFMIDGVKCGPDGVRVDVDGNLWVSSNGGRALGYSGVTAWDAGGQILRRVPLAGACGHNCVGRPKR